VSVRVTTTAQITQTGPRTGYFLDAPRQFKEEEVRLQFFFVGWDLSHQVLRPLLAYCTAPNDR
jgi:hypothetical protein